MTFSLNLFSSTVAKILKRDGKYLIIDIGIKNGVEIGMKGKIQEIVIVKNNKHIPVKVGDFIVKDVTEDNSWIDISAVVKGTNIDKAVQVEFNTTLISLAKKIEKSLLKKEFELTRKLTDQALKLEPNDEKLISLKEGLDLLLNAAEIPFEMYIRYKRKNSGSPILEGLKSKVYKLDPHLPPEKYFDVTPPIKKNEKGYYELTRDNSHVMIYVPDLNLFVDKYEVSCSQYLKFAKPVGIEMNKITFSMAELKNYPEQCEMYPAIVSYDQAEKYCNTYGMRLPTELEWTKIAGAHKSFKYSWGNEDVVEKKNDENHIYRANSESINDGYVELAPVDSFVKYSSPYGAVNMIGNASEWVKEGYGKGGDFFSKKDDLEIIAKSMDSMYIGFRCVMEAEQ